jgi:hypothetical protein
MPLPPSQRDQIMTYCLAHLPGDLEWHINKFVFIDDLDLRQSLGRAFYSARYMYKVMEALSPKDELDHPFIKFQIIQYASIYEGVVTYLLWTKFSSHEEVKALQTHKAYKPISALGSLTSLSYEGNELHTCLYKSAKTPKNSIPFKDKVDCAVRMGLIEEKFSGDIKHIYDLRNLAHLEAEASRQIQIELDNAKTGYWRMQPFLDGVLDAINSPPLSDQVEI